MDKTIPLGARSSRCALGARRAPAIQLRPWRAGDEDAFEPRADFAEEAAASRWAWGKGPPGPTWSLIQGAQVLGIGGAVKGEDDAWLAWATLAPLSRRQWARAIDLAGVVVDHLFAHKGARWIWAQCRAENPAAERVLRKLGFALHHIERSEALGGLDVKCMIREG